jgi:hypothetical protein
MHEYVVEEGDEYESEAKEHYLN